MLHQFSLLQPNQAPPKPHHTFSQLNLVTSTSFTHASIMHRKLYRTSTSAYSIQKVADWRS